MSKTASDVLVILRNYFIKAKKEFTDKDGGNDLDIIIKGTGYNSMTNGLEQGLTSHKRIYLDLISSVPLGNSSYSGEDGRSSETLWNHTIQLQFFYNYGAEMSQIEAGNPPPKNWAFETCMKAREFLKMDSKEYFFDEKGLSIIVNDSYQQTNASTMYGAEGNSIVIMEIDVRCIYKVTRNTPYVDDVDLEVIPNR